MIDVPGYRTVALRDSYKSPSPNFHLQQKFFLAQLGPLCWCLNLSSDKAYHCFIEHWVQMMGYFLFRKFFLKLPPIHLSPSRMTLISGSQSLHSNILSLIIKIPPPLYHSFPWFGFTKIPRKSYWLHMWQTHAYFKRKGRLDPKWTVVQHSSDTPMGQTASSLEILPMRYVLPSIW